MNHPRTSVEPCASRLTRFFLFVLSVLVWFCPSPAQAGTIVFNNFGTNDSYNSTAGNIVGNGFTGVNFAEGDTFTPSQTGPLSQIVIALELEFSFSTNAGTIRLQSDSGLQPGTVLESWSVSNLPLSDNNLHIPTTVTDVSNVELVAGTRYWVVVSTTLSSSLLWMLNNTGDSSAQAISTDGGATWFSPSGMTPGAYRVTENVSSVPEPSSLALMTIGLGVLAGGYRLRRRR